MRRRLSPAVVAGLIASVPFCVHGMIPNSHSWPMIWPVLAGAMSVYVAVRRMVRPETALGSILLGAKAGAVAGGVCVVVVIPSLYLLSLPQFESVARVVGADGPIVVTGAALLATAAVIAFISVPAGAIGGLLGSLVFKERAA